MRTLFLQLLSISVLIVFVSCSADTEFVEKDPVDYVNPFVGTDAHGHTYPGAATPFGIVQLSPDTRLTGWDGCSGYHYSDSIIYGFSHTALNGTGVSDYGDVLIMPVVGEPVFDNKKYSSYFKKENEHAEAGYYSVFLEKPQVLAELTATTRTGFHRYTFPETKQANIIIDLEHRDKVLDAWIEVVNNYEIHGLRRSSNWADDMYVYFTVKFSRAFNEYGLAIDDEIVAGANKVQGTNVKAYFNFDTYQDEQIVLKVGISAVSADGALGNLIAEAFPKTFDEAREAARASWNEVLSKIKVKSKDEAKLRTFYTALYHSYLQPNTYSDVDGSYRGIDGNIYKNPEHTNYTVFSLWDTYRTWHPLMTILEQEKTNQFIRVFLDMYEKGGLLPVWELAANETFCMIGYHSVSVIADAWMKGIRDYDGELALEAMINSAMQDHFGLAAYRKYGHIPGDMEHESISKTLEYAYDDWCIAQMAKEMGKDEIYREFIRRAQYYKNIFDPSTGFMRPKLNGGWLEPFDPTRVDWHFTEANSWHYSFYVPQDISGFIALHGGKDKLAEKIDELFTTTDKISGRDMKDITGLIGQYAQGNEPSHHMAYLYNFVNQPWKTQQMVRRIMDDLYSDKPDGRSGNEDCGQMSAWLVMSAMGFYPVTPGKPEYIIGTPWFPEVEINLENGNIFKITANNVSEKNIYIQSAKLNGKEYNKSYISHFDIMNGGHLHFEMGSKPNKKWGVGEGNIPVTKIEDELIVPVPFFSSHDARFKDNLSVSINTITDNTKIFYSLDGSTPDKTYPQYKSPLSIDKTSKIKAVAYIEGKGYSFPVTARFYKLDLTRSIEILSEWSPSYHAGGPEALIDELRGPLNWRLGWWQGYQGTDFTAIVDLGESQEINKLGAGFLQDIGAWIWMPTIVDISISQDGKHFKRIAGIKNTVPVDDREVQIKDFTTTLQNMHIRYVKIEAKNFGIIPDWHLGAGYNAYIFIDEIIIE